MENTRLDELHYKKSHKTRAKLQMLKQLSSNHPNYTLLDNTKPSEYLC